MSNVTKETYVCKAAFVELMRFLSEIFSNINKALVSCPFEKRVTHVRLIRDAETTSRQKTTACLGYTKMMFKVNVAHLTAGEMQGSVLDGVLQGEVCFCTAHQHLCKKETKTKQVTNPQNGQICTSETGFAKSPPCGGRGGRSVPTALVWPFSAANMSGVLPEASTLLTWALWLSSS